METGFDYRAKAAICVILRPPNNAPSSVYGPFDSSRQAADWIKAILPHIEPDYITIKALITPKL